VAYKATQVAEGHQHAGDGKVLVPVHGNGQDVCSPHRRIQRKPEDPDAVYI
jgi:hypothetical protein